jgi:hypothetical protein
MTNELHLEGYKIECNKNFITKVIIYVILFWYVVAYTCDRAALTRVALRARLPVCVSARVRGW